jgi:hypothetical protein
MASIDLKDPRYVGTSVAPHVLALRTGADGRVTVPVSLRYSHQTSATGRLLSFHVRYPRWEIRVAAEGYEEFVAPFADYERRDPRFDSQTTPPPVEIRLRKR